MGKRAEGFEVPAFQHLQRTYVACVSFTGIVLSTTLLEAVLAAHEGGVARIAVLAVASIAIAFAASAIVALVAAPILDRYADVRFGPKGCAKALVLGTVLAIPLLVNKLAR